ncbi:MAG TPA: flavin-dependent monooxygenase [Kofleriaceae bacterium]|nr:flavin-dependent monooxygenase [Kofleriaceae bacterium]
MTTTTNGPSPSELRARAVAMQAALAERVTEADRLRRVPDATIAAFRDAGFFRMLQPARWGGLEVDPQVFFDVQATVGAACASSAWVLGVLGVHAWQLALFPLEAQQDVWGQDPNTLISSSYAPTGKVTREPGGFQLSGRWSFSSGCDHGQWAFLGGLVPPPAGEAGPPEMRTFLVPRKDWRIEDNWHVMGLKGTGSKDVVIDGCFVPEHRTHRLIDGFKRNSPGNEVNKAPLYKLPFGQVFVRSVSTTAIGIAQSALDAYRKNTASRIAASDGAKVALDPSAQVVAAHAAGVIEDLRGTLHRNFDEMMAAVRAGEDLPLERRLKFRMDSSLVAVRCAEVVDTLFTESGGRAIFDGSPLQRAFLDIHAARAHYANNPEKPSRNFGGVLLGQKNADYFV